MNLNRIGLLALLLAGTCAQAQQEQSKWSDRFAYEHDVDKYTAKEFSFDAFGSYDARFDRFGHMFDRSWRHGDFGGGVGLNYFVTRYFGMGLDTFFESRSTFFRTVSGNVFLRLPLGNSGLAPYIFGGGGGRFQPVEEATGHAGVGLEFRFNHHFGLFGDARYSWADKTTDNALVRAGARFVF